MNQPFFCYHAGPLAVDPARPWQIVSQIGALCGKLATREQAEAAVNALCTDKEAGQLPCNLSTWDKRHLLSGQTPTT